MGAPDFGSTESTSLLQRRRFSLKPLAEGSPDSPTRTPGGDHQPVALALCTEVAVPATSIAVPLAARSCRPPTLLERRRRFAAPSTLNCSLAREEEALPQAALGGRFDVHEALGQGSSAVVYRATRRADGQQVALKLMRVDDEELVSTAKEEFELLRKLSHPNVIKAFDFFTFTRGAVLALEFFKGPSLAEAVRANPGGFLPEETALRLFGQLLGAVQYLHEHGVIHRDVKGQNILVTEDLKDLRLVDFNTARRVQEGALTMTGTPDYMSPEVLSGDSPSAGCDVWASGLCLHLMLAGNLPLTRKAFGSHQAFGNALVDRLGAGGSLNGPAWADVSEQCKALVLRCLEPNLEQRPTASTLLASLPVLGTVGDASVEAQNLA